MKKILTAILVFALCLPFAAAIGEEAAAPTMEGISRVCISTMDLAASEAFYTEKIGLTKVAEGELDRQTCLALYSMDCEARYICLKNSVQSTLMQIIEFAELPQKTSREGYNSWDYGYFDISLRCADIDAVYDEMTGLGYDFICEPYQYTTTWSNAQVYECVMFGPDDVPLAMINKTASTPAFEGMFRNFPDVVTVVDSMDTADKFYVDVMGMSKVFDMEMENGLVDPIVGTAGTDITTRIAMYMGSGQTPVIEVLDFSAEGRFMTLEGASVPGNAGMFANAYLTDDLEGLLGAMAENGFEACTQTVEMNLAPYGNIRAAMVSGPNGTLVELFEMA
ncbi:MAG: VOC family protein [Clostridia bacterium]|nr:VOC family protein [Clostridia bacterium]